MSAKTGSGMRWPRGHDGAMVGEHRQRHLSVTWAWEQGTLTQAAARLATGLDGS
jgi:hypothetical protein